MKLHALASCVIVLLIAACGASPGTPSASNRGGSVSPASGVLPLGDGRVSTAPRAGYVWSCQTTFNGPGAMTNGPWINANGTWDPGKKLKVQGDVTWSQARYSASVSGAQRIIETQDLPIDQGTGVFPIGASDPAHAYDMNPNRITAQGATLTLSAVPVAAAQPSCVGMGAIGVLTDGVYLFDALDALGRDAVAHEILDRCDGHPAPGGVYHHHDIPSCMLAAATGASTLVGYAMDGFGIYVERDPHGALLTNADLDACHGRVSPVVWDGTTVTMYHYDATAEYPYVIGCYHGTPVAPPNASGGAPPRGGPPFTPPPG